MQIEFVRSWRRHRIGSQWSPDDPVATILIRRGIAMRSVAPAIAVDAETKTSPVRVSYGKKKRGKA